MDIVGLIKLIVRIALIVIPILTLVTIVSSYTTDLALLMGYMTDNPFILISAMTLDRMLDITFFAICFATVITAACVALWFRLQ